MNENLKKQSLENEIMSDPFNYALHQKLASYYLDKNLSVSEYEFSLSDELFQNHENRSKVLGIKSGPLSVWKSYQGQRERILHETEYWLDVLKHHPDYGYADLKLSALYAAIDEAAKSASHLEKYRQKYPGRL